MGTRLERQLHREPLLEFGMVKRVESCCLDPVRRIDFNYLGLDHGKAS